MGLLERLRPPADEPWHPPAPGMCRCESHVDYLLEIEIPYADGSGVATAAELVAAGALTTFASPAGRLHVDDPVHGERRGPFHWRILCEGGLQPYFLLGAPIGLDDAIYVQPGVERVLWRPGVEMAIGAPHLCARGVQGAVIRALGNPRLRETP